jgi:hypothetical protein
MVQTYLARYSRATLPPIGFALVTMVVAALAYAWTRDVYFLQDDLAFSWITRNGKLDAGQVFRWALPTWQVRDEVLRPLTVLNFAVDFFFFGTRAGVYHAVNAGFHALNAALLLLFAFRLGAARAAAFAGALLWALYPGHVEAVAWVLHRMVLQCFFFSFVALHLWLSWARRGGRGNLAGALVAWVLALACKETAFVLPAVIALLALAERAGTARARLRAAAIDLIPWVAVFGLYLAWRYASFGRIVPGYGAGHTVFEYAERADFRSELLRALLRFVWPVNPDWGRTTAATLGWGVALASAIGLALLGSAVRRALVTGLGLFACTLVTAGPFLRVDEGLVNSRHYYFPAAGLYLLVAGRRGAGGFLRLGLLVAGAAGSWLALRHDAGPYRAAGGEVAALHRQALDAVARLEPGTRLVLAEVPLRRAGAPAFGGPTSVEAAFQRPWTPRDVPALGLFEGTTYDLDAVLYGLHPPGPGEGPAAAFRWRRDSRELEELGSPATLLQVREQVPVRLFLVTPPEDGHVRLEADPAFRFTGETHHRFYRLLFRVGGRIFPVSVPRERMDAGTPGRLEYRLSMGDLSGRSLLDRPEVRGIRGAVGWWVEGFDDPTLFRAAQARSLEAKFTVTE